MKRGALEKAYELSRWVLGHIVRVENPVGSSPEVLQEPPLVTADLLCLAQRLKLVFPAEQVQPVGGSRPHGVLGKQPVLFYLLERWCEPVRLDIVVKT